MEIYLRGIIQKPRIDIFEDIAKVLLEEFEENGHDLTIYLNEK